MMPSSPTASAMTGVPGMGMQMPGMGMPGMGMGMEPQGQRQMPNMFANLLQGFGGPMPMGGPQMGGPMAPPMGHPMGPPPMAPQYAPGPAMPPPHGYMPQGAPASVSAPVYQALP